MAKKPSPSERVADRMIRELDSQTARLVTKLQADFQGADRENVGTPMWHEIIRQNWQDPIWRQDQSDRMGSVPFVHDALAAFGVPTSALRQVQTGESMPVGPHLNPTQPLPPEALA